MEGSADGPHISSTAAGPYCDHGNWDNGAKTCICESNWRIAGPTDTFSFLRGSCSQSECVSDEQCQEDLGSAGGPCDTYCNKDTGGTCAIFGCDDSRNAVCVDAACLCGDGDCVVDGSCVPCTSQVLDEGDHARCLVTGWNCWCGWKYAWSESWTGFSNDKAKCMGVLYVMSFSGEYEVVKYMQWAWIPFTVLAIMFLPIGQTHVRCQHNSTDFKSCFFKQDRYRGPSSHRGVCDGSCAQHPISDWCYTFAWSLYILDLMVWSYFMLVIAYLTLLVTWAVLMWLIIIVTLVLAALYALTAWLCSMAGCIGDCSVPCSVPCSMVACNGDGDCSVPSCDGPSCYRCCNNCCDGCCNNCCNGPAGLAICLPLACMISMFPKSPPNMWGGFLGWCMGTGDGGRYAGGNSIIDRLSFRSATDMRSFDLNNDWRDRVATHIYSLSLEPAGATTAAAAPPGGGRRLERPLLPLDRLHGKVLVQTDAFVKERDNIVDSCYDDYVRNECWICSSCNSGRPDVPLGRRWHLWLGCGHMFCHQCSAEMARRQMPCPLCRRATNRIKEGPCYSPDAFVRQPNVAVQLTQANVAVQRTQANVAVQRTQANVAARDPDCPVCLKNMRWSDDMPGAYAGGIWLCENRQLCGTSRGRGHRWFCKGCSKDFCSKDCLHQATGLPAGWAEHKSKSTGKTYYFCEKTGKAQFEFPTKAQATGTSSFWV